MQRALLCFFFKKNNLIFLKFITTTALQRVVMFLHPRGRRVPRPSVFPRVTSLANDKVGNGIPDSKSSACSSFCNFNSSLPPGPQFPHLINERTCLWFSYLNLFKFLAEKAFDRTKSYLGAAVHPRWKLSCTELCGKTTGFHELWAPSQLVEPAMHERFRSPAARMELGPPYEPAPISPFKIPGIQRREAHDGNVLWPLFGLKQEKHLIKCFCREIPLIAKKQRGTSAVCTSSKDP